MKKRVTWYQVIGWCLIGVGMVLVLGSKIVGQSVLDLRHSQMWPTFYKYVLTGLGLVVVGGFVVEWPSTKRAVERWWRKDKG